MMFPSRMATPRPTTTVGSLLYSLTWASQTGPQSSELLVSLYDSRTCRLACKAPSRSSVQQASPVQPQVQEHPTRYIYLVGCHLLVGCQRFLSCLPASGHKSLTYWLGSRSSDQHCLQNLEAGLYLDSLHHMRSRGAVFNPNL